LVSKKEYRGVNLFLLSCSPYGSPYWLTFKQAQERGCHIRKGEKATMVVFWKMLDRFGVGEADEAEVDGGEHTRNGKIPLLRYYNVFNWCQTEGIPEPPKQEVVNIFTPIEKAEQIVEGMPLRPEILHGGNVASYSVRWDRIKMPEKHTFNSSEEYYCTLLHELSHATGHEKRLARKSLTEVAGFGSHEYSKEELVAEMSAAFLCWHRTEDLGELSGVSSRLAKSSQGRQETLGNGQCSSSKGSRSHLEQEGRPDRT
jgi:antirestriction protein ArdC